MGDSVSAQVAGLQLSNNTFTASPPGSMSLARNGVIAQKGVFQPRNGQEQLLDLSTQRAFALGVFDGELIVYSDTARGGSAGRIGHASLDPTSSSLTNYSGGPYNPLFGQNACDLRFSTANDYLYWCCADGPRALETLTGPPRLAGLLRVPDAVNVSLVDASTLTPGFLPYNAACAYRLVLRRPTNNGSSLLSPPSSAAIASNRILAPVGALTRGGGTVTVTMTGGFIFAFQGLNTGDTFSLSPGEANFPAGTYTVATISSNLMTYTDGGGGTHTSAVAQEINPGPNALLATKVEALLPPDAIAGDFMRLYRSVNTSNSTVAPNADLFLTNEVKLTGTDISNGFVIIEDTTPESQIFDPLYTNPTIGAGLEESNFRPPLYRDMAVWQGQAWYFNITGFQELRIQMLGVGATNGVQDGDTLTIDGVAFRFKTVPAVAHDVLIVSNGTPSQNITQTTFNLISRVNILFAGVNSIRLYNDSDIGELGGKILIQRTDYGAAFDVAASRALTWTPALTATSDNNNAPANLAPSKVGQPEAVAPADEIGQIGSRSWPGLRLLALKQSLIVCKGGDGIYAVTGQPGNYQTRQISTANCIAPNCCAVFSDQAWVYTDQGIIKITDSGGAQVISRQIETELNALYTQFPGFTYRNSFAVAYETERRIMFFVAMPNPSMGVRVGADPTVIWAFTYSNATQSWTGPYERNQDCGIVALSSDRSHHLVLGGPDPLFGFTTDNTVSIERKSFTYLDQADEDFAQSIVSLPAGSRLGGTVVTLQETDVPNGAALGVSVGDGIEQMVAGSVWRTKIIAERFDIAPATYELLEVVPFTAAACTIYRHFEVEAQFLPVGNPTNRKPAASLVFLFKPDAFEMAMGLATVLTDQVQAEVEVPLVSTGFGLGPFGVGSFGNPSPLAPNVWPLNVSDANQYFVGIKTAEVWTKMLFEGFSLRLDEAAGPAGRGK